MKTYKMETIGLEHVIPIPVGEENQYVKFVKTSPDDSDAYLDVKDKKLQKAIEASNFFKEGIVQLFFESDSGESDSGVEYPDVTDFQTAKEILKKEHGVAPQALGSPEKIFAQAAKAGVSFPNLKEEE